MTAYSGGKKRIGKQIHHVIRETEKKILGDKAMGVPPYFEPFIGMGGVMVHFAKESSRSLFACDLSEDIIVFWDAVKNNWKPPLTCSLEKYNELKHAETSPERTFIGIVGSWGCNFFSNFRNKYPHKDFIGEGARAIEKVREPMKKVGFISARSYDEFNPVGMTIYCDPPYKNNRLGPKSFREFDHEKFWNVMRKWSLKNLVFISEMTAPDDFYSIWDHDSYFCNAKKQKKYKESLFVSKNNKPAAAVSACI